MLRLSNHRRQATPHEVPARPHRLRAGRAIGEEGPRHAQRAELDRSCVRDLLPPAEHHLGRTAAHVDQHHVDVPDGQRLQRPEPDEAGLLVARDDLHVDARLHQGTGQELTRVARLAHGGGGHGEHRGVQAVGELTAPGERGDSTVDGVLLEVLHLALAGTQAHHLLEAGDDLESVVAGGSRHDHVDRVGADVDGGQHLGEGTRGTRAGGQGHGRECTAGPTRRSHRGRLPTW